MIIVFLLLCILWYNDIIGFQFICSMFKRVESLGVPNLRNLVEACVWAYPKACTLYYSRPRLYSVRCVPFWAPQYILPGWKSFDYVGCITIRNGSQSCVCVCVIEMECSGRGRRHTHLVIYHYNGMPNNMPISMAPKTQTKLKKSLSLSTFEVATGYVSSPVHWIMVVGCVPFSADGFVIGSYAVQFGNVIFTQSNDRLPFGECAYAWRALRTSSIMAAGTPIECNK